MKNLVKIPALAAVVLGLATAGVSSARAGGFPVAAGVAGGLVAGTIVARTVVHYAPPTVCYVYPQRVYAAPVVAPICVPAPVIVQPAPVFCAPVPVVYPVYCPPVRPVVFAARPHYLIRRR